MSQVLDAATGTAPAEAPSGLKPVKVNNRVRRVDGSGTITTVAGTTAGFSGDGGPATAAQMSAPSDVAVLPDGSILISDSNNNRIRKIDTSGIITTVAGTGAASDEPSSVSDEEPIAHTADLFSCCVCWNSCRRTNFCRDE